MTKLSTRTIRRFIQSEILTGKKIGGQWRFTEEDYLNFLDSADFSEKLDTQNQSLAQKYINNEFSDLELAEPKSFLIQYYPFASQEELNTYKQQLLETYNQSFSEQGNNLSLTQVGTYRLKVTYEGTSDFIKNIINL